MPALRARRLRMGAATLACWLLSQAARADETVELEYDADAGCPDAASVQRMLDAYLDGGVDTRQLGEQQVEIRIGRADDGRFVAEVGVEGEQEAAERRFLGASCKDVAEAAALIAAMLLDPTGVAERVAERAPNRAREPKNARVHLALGAHVLGDAGSVPSTTVGGGITLSVRAGLAHVGLRASALLAQRTEDVPEADGGGELALYAGGLRAGYGLLRAFDAHLTSGPEVGLEAGAMRGRGRGSALGLRREERQLWLAPALGWGLEVSAGSLAIGLLAEALFPLHRPRWVLEGYGELFRPPPVTGRLSIELAWLLPWP